MPGRLLAPPTRELSVLSYRLRLRACLREDPAPFRGWFEILTDLRSRARHLMTDQAFHADPILRAAAGPQPASAVG